MPHDTFPRISRHRARLTRFEVEGFVPGIGNRKHIIRAEDDATAWAQFCRAYPRVICSIQHIRRPRDDE